MTGPRKMRGISGPHGANVLWLCSTPQRILAPMSLSPPLPDGAKCPAYHFSVDDVFESLLAPVEHHRAIADQPVIRFLLNLAQLHGTQTDLYVFLTDPPGAGSRSLHHLPDPVCVGLAALDGLRFGPHGRDYETAPHAQTLAEQERTVLALYDAIARFCSRSKLSRWVRLHYFSECYELAPVLLAHGVKALLLTDKPAITYRLGDAHKAALIGKSWTEKNELAFIRSHLRFERCLAEGLSIRDVCARAGAIVDRFGFVVLFTHEIDLANPHIRDMTQECIRSLDTGGVRSL